MNTKIRLTKEFYFEAAHSLWNYDGKCKNIHGHSYKLSITVIGTPQSDTQNPKLGMVLDFGDLKKIAKEEVVDKFDHAYIVNKAAPTEKLHELGQMFNRHEIVDYQPTCENMVIDIAQRIAPRLPQNVKLFSIKLYETATSYAEWYANDNE